MRVGSMWGGRAAATRLGQGVTDPGFAVPDVLGYPSLHEDRQRLAGTTGAAMGAISTERYRRYRIVYGHEAT